ncbi:sigma-54-dependent transcriptional regulator [Novipirellula artificiosorum]|uniref:DNA-binding transcriptional regulator NtrC n=1 Tax=Novipirellula artificiosorum TaxID=2528016 RepID=A0A5C6D6N1_9BACT|nr:sigma-54 dependent transcriptional regulator [Novipirellula artificiosorum]TWU32488.1 Nitrogen assimilation regulatory protein [Novipirellula artificiosorum]
MNTNETNTLLVIDDDPLILQVMRLCLPEPDYHVLTAQSAAQGLKLFVQHEPDAVLLDIQLPDESGLTALQQFLDLDRRVPVILMTGHGTAETAIGAMSGGAFEYITKPFEPDDMLPVIDSALETSLMARRPAVLPSEDQEAPQVTSDRVLGNCPAMVEVFRSIGRVASRDVAVLILGETGTGKEVVARAIYQHSSRQDRVFHAINCAAIPDALLESELFGHEKGAFTGADQKRIGKFEICNGGTLFLDEIGDMAPAMQMKLLRVLQEKEFERVGGSRPIKTDVRILAATNRDLVAAMADGSFRSDLFYRLNEFTMRLPALRERGDDVKQMIEYFFAQFAALLGKPLISIAPETMQHLMRHPWPGNVRELQGVIKQTLLKASGPVITPGFLPCGFAGVFGEHSVAAVSESSSWESGLRARVGELAIDGSHGISAEIHDAVDRIMIREVLAANQGNLSATCNRLGISRPTLRSRLKQLGLQPGIPKR